MGISHPASKISSEHQRNWTQLRNYLKKHQGKSGIWYWLHLAPSQEFKIDCSAYTKDAASAWPSCQLTSSIHDAGLLEGSMCPRSLGGRWDKPTGEFSSPAEGFFTAPDVYIYLRDLINIRYLILSWLLKDILIGRIKLADIGIESSLINLKFKEKSAIRSEAERMFSEYWL